MERQFDFYANNAENMFSTKNRETVKKSLFVTERKIFIAERSARLKRKGGPDAAYEQFTSKKRMKF